MADDDVGVWLNRLPKVGALVDGVCDALVPKSGCDFSVCVVGGPVVGDVKEGN